MLACPDEILAQSPQQDRSQAGQSQRAKGTPSRDDEPFPNRFKAPSLDGGVEWLNTSGPIRLEDLRGKIVVLDFWTYCCINCIHMLPVLKQLEEKYENELVVIGVHSAKFDTEKGSENIRQAILRYEINHPVINDAEMTVWRKHQVRSWPTIRVIDPEGYIVAGQSGEIPFEIFDAFIGGMIEHYKTKGTLQEGPLRFDLEKYSTTDTPLRYPGKVLADEAGNRLFIADSNHNRIVVATLDGAVLETVGSGRIGAEDGAFDKASFDHPQGMALGGEILYVADTENHLIRKVDLAAKTVSTIAGTGEQATFRSTGGEAKVAALNSPWDLELLGSRLYIAMAGPHQIWVMDLQAGTVGIYAGSGREDILDGPLEFAALAQPSGITSGAQRLFLVDSEGSAVRSIAEGRVTTIAGPHDLPSGQSLFTFADVDGSGDDARFQHPIGLVFHHEKLYVADTYNNKIKVVDPETGATKTLFGDGEPGKRDAPPRFDEPAGIAAAGQTLFIADTNNHVIRTADLTSGTVGTLELVGLAAPKPPKARPTFPNATVVKADLQEVQANDELVVQVELELPAGFKLNPAVPTRYLVESQHAQGIVQREALGMLKAIAEPRQSFEIRLPVAATDGEDSLRISVLYYSCREGAEAVCKIHSAVWEIPIRVSPAAKSKQVVLRTEKNERTAK